MSANGNTQEHRAELEFAFSRTFDAPRSLVWDAWTKAEHLSQWWGPKGFTVEVVKLELRPGGMFLYRLEGPGEFVLWGRFIYLDVQEPDKFSYIMSFSDAEGGVTQHPLSPSWPAEVRCDLVFTEEGGRTTVSSVSYPVNADAEAEETFLAGHESMTGGYKGTLDKLEEYLAEVKGV